MRRLFAYGLTIALLAACSTQEKDFQTPQQDDVIFYATFEQPAEEGTRVYANEDLLLRWTADDRVSIFNKLTYNQQYRFAGETGDNAGGFRKVDTDEFVTGNAIPHVVSVYPYQETTKITESESLTVTLPAEQHYTENTFGLGANTMVSVSSDNVLQYKNVGGYLMLKLYGEGVSVSSITLKGNNGEKLAGNATVKMPVDGDPSVEMASEATTEITLICETPVQLGATAEKSTQFWFVIPPVTFSKGFTVSITKTSGSVFEKSTSKSVTIERNHLSKMSPIEVEGGNPVTPSVPEAVDLGLSVKWASFNLGATKPEEYGDYFAWGETEPYYSSPDPLTWKEGKEAGYSWASYRWCMGEYNTLTKYCSNSEYGYNGFTDNKTVLDLEDDAAYVNLGGSWRMPTDAEWTELRENCTWTWTTQNGVGGRLVTGSNGNSIFLPAAGYRGGTSLYDVGSDGDYWSSSLFTSLSSLAWYEGFNSSSVYRGSSSRYYGRSVRPVCEISVESISLDRPSLDGDVGDEYTLVATLLPANATEKTVTWASNNNDIATVDSNGKVTLNQIGSCIITAIAGQFSASCTVNVVGYKNAVDLSSNGSANCYIVPSTGVYRFKATKGNSSTTIEGASAEILWRSFNTSVKPNSNDIIVGPLLKDGYVYFATSKDFKQGNAVVAVKSQNGTVLWSWHIWVTDANLEALKQTYANNAGVMMDRNLGALSAESGNPLSFGLLYEWGRKDPFTGCASYESTTPIATDADWPSATNTRTIIQQNLTALDYSISHPMQYIYNSELPYDWQALAQDECDFYLWKSTKTIYDPCPPGWRVPDGGENGLWKKAGIPEGSLYNSAKKGIWIQSPYCTPDAWYPSIGGGRQWNGGGINHVGEWGNYWSCTYMYESWMDTYPVSWNYYYSFDFYSSATRASSHSYSGQGQAVRCCKE